MRVTVTPEEEHARATETKYLDSKEETSAKDEGSHAVTMPPRLPFAFLAANCARFWGRKDAALRASRQASLDSWMQTKLGVEEQSRFLTTSHH